MRFMNILLYSLKLRAELLMKTYQEVYQKLQENAKKDEIMGSEMPEIPEYV